MTNAPIFEFEPYMLKSFLSSDKYINIKGAISEDGSLYEIGQYENTDIPNTMITEIWVANEGNWNHGTLVMKLRTEELGLSFIPQELFERNQMLGIIAYCGMSGFNSLVILDPKVFVIRKDTNFSEYRLLSDQRTLWPPLPEPTNESLDSILAIFKATEEPLMPSLSSKCVFADNELGAVEIIYPKH